MGLEREAQRKGDQKEHCQFQGMGAQDHNKWLSSPLGGLHSYKVEIHQRTA